MLDTIEWLLRPSQLIVMFVALFLGVCFGWFFKKRHPVVLVLFTFIGLMLFAPILEVLEQVDHFILSAPFIIGALIHPVSSRVRR